MKKFFAAMILIFVISSVSYGAENKDGEYIRKEVFDARAYLVEFILGIYVVALSIIKIESIIEDFRKPSINLKDVEQLTKRLIEENNAKLAKQNPSLIP
ncbi:MAG: hypothetical protein IJP69_09305 [Synergistaceae bacterium]|nr:hypothetical protein [Synergistaceae bacterium]MBR0080554.1 hypothetical protein [Synergistaceae bacterium]MBR0234479.1 hypothetical protein [Synergistaceae bacterium]